MRQRNHAFTLVELLIVIGIIAILIGILIPVVNSARKSAYAASTRNQIQVLSNAIDRYYTDYAGLMTHFDQILPGRVHRVFYENMVLDTECQVRQLLAYCGLPFDAACLRFHETDRAVRTASAQQVRQPLFRHGMESWRDYEPWLGPLKQALGETLNTYPITLES